MVKFHSYQNRPLSVTRVPWLIFIGASIGAATRAFLLQFKWVGLFAIALVGLCSMEDLWEKFGGFRMRVPLRSSSSQMSSLFRLVSRAMSLQKNPVEAAYGSKVTFKNMGQGGGLLHSHV
ncbi:hypothetical protein A4X03_0g9778 [Tilletia caries]|uniref:ArnT-like N-terminal domain-containing protein n=1 Tax=Tilletia caries TaxID=13290 RepID=A0A8T8S985_9BASI|nr:hypothetical protein A4X03_0g9778 [Tilletia caries]CAD6923011.1 unnamed protein product [Tilletia caries]